jgi:hypothetical protein
MPPGAWATIFVPDNQPLYTKMVERTKTADSREWKYGKADTSSQTGIWVAFGWLHDVSPRGFSNLSAPAREEAVA